jgi:aryl-alcohol dehydrogenase-like predicted oxidoreductase
MQYRKLGKSNFEVSEIGFGCMSLRGEEASDIKLIHKAIESGINFFDTADLYDHGRNEILLGKAIKEKRKQIILATKVGNQWRKDGSGWDWNPRKEYILECIDKSLHRLNTDYIDLYQLHGGTIEDPIDETIEAFEILKSKGKILNYGISSIRPNVIREYLSRSAIVSVMMQYSLLDRRPEESCISLISHHNIGILARGVLAKGLLVNKEPESFLNYTEDQVETQARAIEMLSSPVRASDRIALSWCLQQPAISSAVVGIRTPDQLRSILGKADEIPLTHKEFEKISNVLSPNKYELHR